MSLRICCSFSQYLHWCIHEVGTLMQAHVALPQISDGALEASASPSEAENVKAALRQSARYVPSGLYSFSVSCSWQLHHDVAVKQVRPIMRHCAPY